MEKRLEKLSRLSLRQPRRGREVDATGAGSCPMSDVLNLLIRLQESQFDVC
jgi:hypothetical protein